MRFSILSQLMLVLIWPGVISAVEELRKPKPVQCKNPRGRVGASILSGCSRAVCTKNGKKGSWVPCSKPALETSVKNNGEKLDKNEEMSLEILKILGKCCPTSTTWGPASTTFRSEDGEWGPWGNWSPCDSSSGTKKRSRQCDSPSPLNGGASCAGNSQESVRCPVIGMWSPWGNWSPCDSSSGTKKRSRQCDSPSPLNGGASCAGNSQESVRCPVNGGWSSWRSWAPCDSNTGTKKRTKHCDNPRPLNGGAPCAGNSHESANCPRFQCHHWTAKQLSGLPTGAAQKAVCEAGGPEYVFTQGNDAKAPGCGGCWCCRKVPAYLCHHWTAKQLSSLSTGATQKAVCDAAGPEYVFTQGNEAQAPGCGSCWCCRRLIWKPILDCFTGLAITFLAQDKGAELSTKPVTGEDNQMWAFDSDGRIVNKARDLVIEGSWTVTMQDPTPLTDSKEWHLSTDIRSAAETAAKTVPKLVNGNEYCLNTANRFLSQGSKIIIWKCKDVNPDNACWKF